MILMSNITNLKNDFSRLPKKYQYDGWILIPKGEYEAMLETWVTFRFMSSSRIALIFSIVECGEFNGVHVPAFFGLKSLKGKPREKGGFIASPRGDLMAFFYGLNPSSPKIRPDRIPLSNLDGLYRIKVDGVEKNRKQKKHPEQMKYSKVIDAELI